MIRKILVANRGEIACRVFRTAHRMGIRTVAVFSDADRDALHTRSAGEAFHVGPAPAADSYLNIARLLEALTSSGADAVHPGYGFLAENPAFAEAVTHAGRTFVGPGPKAMRAVGNKRSARQLMQDAGLPVIPGVNDIDTLPALRDAASEIGFPIMLKAAAGGGGRGMRRVETPEELNTAFETCRREAQAAFGDARLLAERCIDYARHIEVQVLADSHGGFVHLFERDCSAQRRHQKILEEAPAPGIDPGMAHDIRTAAIAAARAVDYLGAGTVEFLVPEGGGFYFLEMNARLQVEHPVTEAVTGLDLVEWQIRVAAGEPLPLSQDAIRIFGHAIEARFCAEDPANNFMPAPGVLCGLALPSPASGLRTDTGVENGDRIPPDYDSMIAKIIAHGPDRKEALARLAGALSETRVATPSTNLEFLSMLVDSSEFVSGVMETGLVERMLATDRLTSPPPRPEAVAATAVGVFLTQAKRWRRVREQRLGGRSPFSSGDGWRIGAPARHVQRLYQGNRMYTVQILPLPSDSGASPVWEASVDDEFEPHIVQFSCPGLAHVASGCGAQWRPVRVEAGEDQERDWWAFIGEQRWRFEVPDSLNEGTSGADGTHAFRAPLPGHILRHHVRAGDPVEAGDKLVTVEAMKTEHTIRAPAAGRVVALHGVVGSQVEEGEELLVFEARNVVQETA